MQKTRNKNKRKEKNLPLNSVHSHTKTVHLFHSDKHCPINELNCLYRTQTDHVLSQHSYNQVMLWVSTSYPVYFWAVNFYRHTNKYLWRLIKQQTYFNARQTTVTDKSRWKLG